MLFRGSDLPLPLTHSVRDLYVDAEKVVHAGHLVVLCRGLPLLVDHRRGNPTWYSA